MMNRTPAMMNRTSAGEPQWVVDTPYRGQVNNAFIAKIQAHPDLKSLWLMTASKRTSTLVLSDFFDDPEYDGGSEYDVNFSPLEGTPGWWQMRVGMPNGPKLLKFLEKALRVRRMDKSYFFDMAQASRGTGKTARGKTAYQSQADQFTDALKKKWQRVMYDSETGDGSADLGLFAIKFHQSGSDGGIVVNFTKMPRMKSDAKTILDVLDDLAALWRRVD